ncbi:MAG: site-specific integrase [Clostridiales bacterium]|nr:site-specific integrase [Clostridiales bacterium]
MPVYKMKGSKDGKQKYRVRINYQDSMGVNRQIDRVAYGNAEAKELERQLMYEIKEEAPAKRMTLNDLFEEYINTKRHEVRESSLRKSITILKNHVLPELGTVQLPKLNKPVLTKWKNHMEEKTIKSKDGVKTKLSIVTKQNVFGEFRAMLNYAVKMDYIHKNLLCSIGNFKSTLTPKKEMDYYTPDEFKLYIKSAREYAEECPVLIGWDYYVIFSIAFYTGLRKGEIHALKWSDIDGEFLSVSRSITQKLKGEDRETAPKNQSSIRTLQIPKPLISILNEHKERCRQLQGFNDDFRICGGTKPLRDSTLSKMNMRFAEMAELKHIRIHDFRHSHASLLANEGINIQEIARRLGHSKIEITWNTYSHLYPREEERAIKILNKIV